MSESAPPRLRVGVIGTGRVGAVLGAALRRAGHPVVAGHGVSDLSRVRAEALLPGVPLVEPSQVVEQADLVLLCVRDDALADVAAGLARTAPVHAGQMFVHASGRYGLAALDPLADAGGIPVALHPVMSFTGTSLDLARLEGCPFGVTSWEAMRPAAETLVVEMGGEPVWVPEQARPMYHAALSHGSNHLMTLVVQSLDLLRRAGVDDPARLISPLLHASLDNALRIGPQALTGPVARGDAATVRAHLEALSADDADSRATYIALARATADTAIASGVLRAELAEELLGVLGREVTSRGIRARWRRTWPCAKPAGSMSFSRPPWSTCTAPTTSRSILGLSATSSREHSAPGTSAEC